MKLWKSLLITGIALSSFNLAAADSGQHFTQSAKHSALAASNGLQGSGQVVASVVATPIVVVGASTVVAGSAVLASGMALAESADSSVPLEIGDAIVVGCN
ncbi:MULTISPECIES: hypothetical protein [unclassified Agarivorans]|uniref:hypothetical protein n=1 Tax=unclassified Agarivorans TaxID=2636026 RepID=UPI003D7CEE49